LQSIDRRTLVNNCSFFRVAALQHQLGRGQLDRVAAVQRLNGKDLAVVYDANEVLNELPAGRLELDPADQLVIAVREPVVLRL